MKVSWVEEALQESQSLDEDRQSAVRRFVDRLAEDGIEMDGVGPPDGLEAKAVLEAP